MSKRVMIKNERNFMEEMLITKARKWEETKEEGGWQGSWLFHQQKLVRFEARKDRGAGARGHEFLLVLTTENLKQLQAAGAEMRASVNRVGNDQFIFTDQ